jgi:hypothetical protein
MSTERNDRERPCAEGGACTRDARGAGWATARWWQGFWHALGGLSNLVAAVASRWPRAGG